MARTETPSTSEPVTPEPIAPVTDPTADNANVVTTPQEAPADLPFIGPMGLVDALQNATTDREPRIDYPNGVEDYLAKQVTVFDGKTNRFKVTVAFTEDNGLAPAILSKRPTAKNLTGDAQLLEAAKHFARLVRQYADDHNLSTVPDTDKERFSVTFRFARPRPAKSAVAPVTVTTVAPPAPAPVTTATA